MEIPSEQRELLPVEEENLPPNQKINEAPQNPPPTTEIYSKPGFQPQQGIPPQQGYPPQPINQPQLGYLPQQGYTTQSGYPSQPTYPTQPGYPSQPGISIQAGYGQPLSYQQNSNNILVNQVKPTYLVSAPVKFRRSPVSIVCPHCKVLVNTDVEETFNCLTCCLYCLTGCIIYACIQCCNGKEVGCCDTKHKCPNCGTILGGVSSL
jgi:hypothetical protein